MTDLDVNHDIATLYRQGFNLTTLAARFSLSIGTIRNRLIALGVPRRSCGRPKGSPVYFKTSETDRQTIVRLASQGIPQIDIAARFGISRQSVFKIIRSSK